LGSDRIPGVLNWQEQIRSWVDALKKQGIKSIEGSLFADATRWEKIQALPSWEWEDIGNYYGAGASALSFHENAYSLTLKAAEKAGALSKVIKVEPPLPSLHFDNQVMTGQESTKPQACIYSSAFSSQIQIQGALPQALPDYRIKGSLHDPASLVVELLTRELEKEKIPLLKKRLARQKARTLIHTTPSPSMREIIYQTNQHSINLYAEHLLKKLGEVSCKEGSTQAGIRATTQFLQAQGVDLEGFHMEDGSGLSRKNLVTTKQLTTLLTQMKKSPLFPAFLTSLPLVQDRVLAKSGSMFLVKGLAGYFGPIAFAILINQCSDERAAEQKIQEILEKLKNLTCFKVSS
jgi:D-alanyl-D-alanine carboxypeptidase/D-alanyl-D-alanine-endopeptidase (penicillin-binding protein 4)